VDEARVYRVAITGETARDRALEDTKLHAVHMHRMGHRHAHRRARCVVSEFPQLLGAEPDGLVRTGIEHLEALPVDSPGHHSHRELEDLRTIELDGHARIR